MKIAIAASAGLLFAGLVSAQPALAQGVPQGSYLRSCSEVRMRGDTLVAYCRRPDGYGNWTWINDVSRCRGEIINQGGWLQCAYGGRRVEPPPPPPPPGYGPPGYGQPGQPGYGQPGRGDPRYGYGDERRERCDRLRREADDLRARLAREFNPLERARIEGRLEEMRGREERCRY